MLNSIDDANVLKVAMPPPDFGCLPVPSMRQQQHDRQFLKQIRWTRQEEIEDAVHTKEDDAKALYNLKARADAFPTSAEATTDTVREYVLAKGLYGTGRSKYGKIFDSLLEQLNIDEGDMATIAKIKVYYKLND